MSVDLGHDGRSEMPGLQIENSIDLHCHFGPDSIGGKSIEIGLDLRNGIPAIESAREAVAAGQAGVVLKSHSFASPSLAAMIHGLFPDLHVFGGICTDYLSGGLNVGAVDAALSMGAKIVWLPTVNSTADHAGFNAGGFDGLGLTVIDSEQRPIAAVREIFDLVRQHDAILATGHTSGDEHYAVVREFARRGKVVVTHAGEEAVGPKLSAQQCVELADLGATIELTALSCTDFFGIKGKSAVETAQMIAAIGPERCVLSTDYGFMKEVPRPVAGFRNFLERLWSEGEVAEADLTTMASRNPAALLGLDV
jgi:Family of unknown function (DUF6282)